SRIAECGHLLLCRCRPIRAICVQAVQSPRHLRVATRERADQALPATAELLRGFAGWVLVERSLHVAEETAPVLLCLGLKLGCPGSLTLFDRRLRFRAVILLGPTGVLLHGHHLYDFRKDFRGWLLSRSHRPLRHLDRANGSLQIPSLLFQHRALPG